MPEYLSPGVYVEEIPSGIVPVQGVGTSTTGMVGQTERGPTPPRLITSWSAYERWYGSHVDPSVSYLPYAAQGFFANGGQRLFIARIARANARLASSDLPAADGGTSLTVSANGPGAWGGRLFVRIRAGSRSGFRLTVLYYRAAPPEPFVDPTDPAKIRDLNRREPTVTEDYDDLDVDPVGSRPVIGTVNTASHLVQVAWSGGTPGVPSATDGFVRLPVEDDADGDPPTAGDYAGHPEEDPNRRTGLEALDKIDEISLYCVPDTVLPTLPEVERQTLAEDVITRCELLHDRFAILDVQRGEGDVNQIRLPRRSDFAAVYYPHVRVLDALTRQPILVPASGHVAGAYAWTDVNRGVHKAPANFELKAILTNDLPTGETPLEFRVGKGEQDILNPIGVNCIRDFRPAGQGIRIWGARTLWSNPDWIYINVRRLFLYVEESVEQALQFAVFEPNDEPLWAKLRRTIGTFLDRVWRDGALMGATAEEAYFVRCDHTTNTPDDILNGRCIVLIGMAAVRPAEFVILRFQQKTLEATAA
jgi:phage tail sheath protein FI